MWKTQDAVLKTAFFDDLFTTLESNREYGCSKPKLDFALTRESRTRLQVRQYSVGEAKAGSESGACGNRAGIDRGLGFLRGAVIRDRSYLKTSYFPSFPTLHPFLQHLS